MNIQKYTKLIIKDIGATVTEPETGIKINVLKEKNQRDRQTVITDYQNALLLLWFIIFIEKKKTNYHVHVCG